VITQTIFYDFKFDKLGIDFQIHEFGRVQIARNILYRVRMEMPKNKKLL